MHLKNFSLIVRGDQVELSPAYDLLSSTLAGHYREELALPVRGKRARLTRADLIDYYGRERLGLRAPVINAILRDLAAAQPRWEDLLDRSFLTEEQKEDYRALITSRRERLGLSGDVALGQ